MAGGTLCPGAVASTLTRSDCGQGIQKLHPRERLDKKVWWGGAGELEHARLCVCVCVCVICVCACIIFTGAMSLSVFLASAPWHLEECLTSVFIQ